MEMKARTDRRNVLKLAGAGILGALAARGLAATEAHAAETWTGGVPQPIWAPVVGSWFYEIHLDLTKIGLGVHNHEGVISFLPGGAVVENNVLVVPDMNNQPTVPSYCRAGAWTILGDPENRQYRYRLNEVFYYPAGQNALNNNINGVARINTPTADIQLSSDGNSFTTIRQSNVFYFYDQNGNQTQVQPVGQNGVVSAFRLTTDYVPPSHFPVGTY